MADVDVCASLRVLCLLPFLWLYALQTQLGCYKC